MGIYVDTVHITPEPNAPGTKLTIERSVNDGWYLLRTQTGRPIEFRIDELVTAVQRLLEA